jgi:hypothetical protein
VKTSKPVLATVILAAVLVIGGCSGTDKPITASTTQAAAPAAAKTKAPTRLRVAALMTKASCDGKVIGTQLYSYETGRCDLHGTTVTIAVFDSDRNRDAWTDAAHQFGGTAVTGPGWAASVEKPDAADTLAKALGGRIT